MKTYRQAFTLVELLVVIAIIGVLVALLLPAVQAAREAARRVSCFNNLKQVGLALHNYHDSHKSFPMGWIGLDAATNRPYAEGTPGWGWAAFVLPYVEQASLSDSVVNMTLPILDPANQVARETFLPVYRCPSDVPANDLFTLGTEGSPSTPLTRLAAASYVGVHGTVELHDCEGLPIGTQCLSDGTFYHLSATRFADIVDGTSNTFAIGERSARVGFSTWVGAAQGGDEALARILGITDHPPNSANGHLDDFGSQHPGGTNFVLADGSVRLISDTVELRVYRGYATRAGGEVVQLD